MPAWIHSDPNADDGHWNNHGLRECARAERCPDSHPHEADGQTIRVGAPTPRAFCDTCRTTIDRALRELPAYWGRVHTTLSHRTRQPGPKVTLPKTAPVPLSLAADELLRDIVAVAVSWWERVAAVARLHVPDTTASQKLVSYDVVKNACSVLAAHLDALLALDEQPMMRAVPLRDAAHLPPGTTGLVHRTAGYADVVLHLDGARAGLEILQLHHRCRRHVGETTAPARHLPTPCRAPCGYKQLFEVLGGDGQFDGARCRQCAATYTAQEYRDLVSETSSMIRKTGAKRRSLAVAGAGDDIATRRA